MKKKIIIGAILISIVAILLVAYFFISNSGYTYDNAFLLKVKNFCLYMYQPTKTGAVHINNATNFIDCYSGDNITFTSYTKAIFDRWYKTGV